MSRLSMGDLSGAAGLRVGVNSVKTGQADRSGWGRGSYQSGSYSGGGKVIAKSAVVGLGCTNGWVGGGVRGGGEGG